VQLAFVMIKGKTTQSLVIFVKSRLHWCSGYSSDLVDGHDRFLRDARPMNSYNGKFGFRRNTPTLRHCPSPFGTASRSSTFWR